MEARAAVGISGAGNEGDEIPKTDEKRSHHLRITRRFTSDGRDPFESVEWHRRDAIAGDFFQPNVECPTNWDDISIGIVAKLYFATIDGVRESSVRQLVRRVANKITVEGIKQGYFGEVLDTWHEEASAWTEDARVFYDELVFILVNQMAAFNTPVWLNFGVPGRQQTASACFLLSVEDCMLGSNSIVEWWAEEAAIFKVGAGSGINLSNLRGSMEELSTGGTASGPVSYMRPADAAAGTLKSGGAHRRAAKLVCLDADHPDIVDFVDCKRREDERMRILMRAGIDLSMYTPEGERNIAEVTSFQNENISVRVSDEFMRAAEEGRDWALRVRRTGAVVDRVDATELMRDIAQAAWRCADPGLLFHDTINGWHTTPSLGPITTCNPCAEVHQNDDTSCNLASLNIARFLVEGDDGELAFDTDAFCHAVDVMITAMDVTCGFTDLPTEAIKRNTREMRQLGLGYMNLGASLMMLGMPYDSDEARSWVSSVTALMTGRAYRRSALLAEAYGPFVRYAENEKPMRRVICRHRDEVMRIEGQKMADPSIWRCALDEWASAMRHGDRCGYRNSQVSVIAPTGTISFMTGCDTTGCEPAYSLVTHKKLAGAGSIVMVNRSVRRALQTLDYSETQIDAIVLHLEKHGELPNGNNPVQERNGDFIRVREQDMPIFATADGATNVIDPMGHVKMIAAIQPFISGAVSKTCNVVEGTTVEDIETLYMEAWRRGIKALSVYRAGSKATEVLSTRGGFDVDAPEPIRKRLPAERAAIAHRFVVDGHEGYVHAGIYEDGSLGEIFITMGKEGTNISGAMNAWATTLSVSLQYGVPLETLVRKFSFMAFEPSGQTLNPEIANARSIVDYIMRWIASRFLDPEIHVELGIMTPEAKRIMVERLDVVHVETDHQPRAQVIEDQVAKEIGPPCPSCGGGMKRTGACWTCQQCGTNTGCG